MCRHLRAGFVPGLIRCVAFVLLLLAQPAYAQASAPDSTRLDSARVVLMSIPLGSRIRVLTVGQSVIEGRLASRSDTAIVIRQRRDSTHASIERIAVIYLPAPNVKSGAIIGGIAGGVVGALFFGSLAQGLCETADCSGAFANGAAVGAALGGAVGAFIGLFIGAFTHHWESVWPRIG